MNNAMHCTMFSCGLHVIGYNAYGALCIIVSDRACSLTYKTCAQWDTFICVPMFFSNARVIDFFTGQNDSSPSYV